MVVFQENQEIRIVKNLLIKNSNHTLKLSTKLAQKNELFIFLFLIWHYWVKHLKVVQQNLEVRNRKETSKYDKLISLNKNLKKVKSKLK